jgi:hypothetical protein
MVEPIELAAFALGFLVLGFGGGLAVYHLEHGWFISRTSQGHLEGAVADAERLLLRRARRRHERESAAARRARMMAEAGPPRGRHLAR